MTLRGLLTVDTLLAQQSILATAHGSAAGARDAETLEGLCTAGFELLEGGSSPSVLAAHYLVGIVQLKPFLSCNRATAWVASMVLLANAGRPLRVEDQALAARIVLGAERQAFSSELVARYFDLISKPKRKPPKTRLAS